MPDSSKPPQTKGLSRAENARAQGKRGRSGGWVQQPTDAIYENGVITWTGTVAGGTEVTLVFTATLGTDSGLYNRTVVNTARFASDNAGSGSAQATFATARRYWVYLPLVMRNWRP